MQILIHRTVFYRAFNSWASHAYWRAELPIGELPDLVACTDSMVFVYTSRGYLRCWSVSGVQNSILTPCDHVVTMVGNDRTLCVVYEDSYPVASKLFLLVFEHRYTQFKNDCLQYSSIP